MGILSNESFLDGRWHTQHVKDGDHDLEAIEAAIEAAKAVKDKPSVIKLTTTIGFGSKLQGTGAVHGSPLKPDDAKNVKASLYSTLISSLRIVALILRARLLCLMKFTNFIIRQLPRVPSTRKTGKNSSRNILRNTRKKQRNLLVFTRRDFQRDGKIPCLPTLRNIIA